MALTYDEIRTGKIYYKKQHEVKVIEKTVRVDGAYNVSPVLEIWYVNQPDHMSPAITGAGNLTEAPLHCYNCRTVLVDRMPLDECNACRRIICPTCNHCHCGTTWDPNK